MKNFYYLCFVLLLCSCSSRTPEQVVVDFLNLKKDFKYDKAYELLSSDDKEYKKVSDFAFKTAVEKSLAESIMSKIGDKVTYTFVKSTDVNRDTIFVTVHETGPDMSKITPRLVTRREFFRFAKMDSDKQDDFLRERIKEIFSDPDKVPFTEADTEYTVVKENSGFKLFMNYGYPVKLEKTRNAITKLINEFFFDEVIKAAEEFHASNNNKVFQKEINYARSVKSNCTELNKSLTVESLEFTPVKVEVKKVDYFRQFMFSSKWDKAKTYDPVFLMTYKVKNISKTESFSPIKNNQGISSRSCYLKDNLGRTLGLAQGVPSTYRIDANNDEGEILKPGQEKLFYIMLRAPRDEKASRFIFKTNLKVTNKNNEKTADFFAIFDRKDL